MTSFQITVSPGRRAAARFVSDVTRALQKAYAEEKKKRKLNHSDIARTVNVHRSIINRQLRGQRDMSLARVAEIAFAMGRKPVFQCPEIVQVNGANADLAIPRTGDGESIAPDRTHVDWSNLPDQSDTRAAP